MINSNKDLKLAIIGLGYVGLPLALEFAKKRLIIGFDINKKRINELNSGIDKNLEFTKKEFQDSNQRLPSRLLVVVSIGVKCEDLHYVNLVEPWRYQKILNSLESGSRGLNAWAEWCHH